MTYILTRPAARDIDSICSHVSRDSRQAAENVALHFADAFELLAANPGIGHRRDELRDRELRVWVVHSYLIIYDPSQSPIVILRVVHGARELQNLSRDIEPV